MGKGSKQRPVEDKDRFNQNWDKIFQKKKRKEIDEQHTH